MANAKINSIKLHRSGFVSKIIFSKPPLNIFNIEDIVYIEQLLQEIGTYSDVKLIVFESDQKVFSAGVDVAQHLPEKACDMLIAFNRLFNSMLNLEIPTLSLVKSPALGGGSEFALFCDFTIASENAHFSQPEIKLGCFPPLSLAHLRYVMGSKKSLELILTGERVSADEALSLGLVNHVFAEKEFDQKSQEFIHSITKNSLSVIKTTLKAYKKINYAGLKGKIEQAEKIFLEELVHLADYEEGARSFIEKRIPIWENE